MNWSFISTTRNSAQLNMGIDQALYEHAALKTGLPVLRLYQWEEPTLSFGHYQDVTVSSKQVCVRRMTSGPAIEHHPEDYSICCVSPIRLFNYSVAVTRRSLHNGLVIALKQLGINAQLRQSTIVVNNKPIVSTAGRALEKGFYLEQSTLHCKRRSKAISVTELIQCDSATIEKALVDGLSKGKNILSAQVVQSVAQRASELAEGKYSTLKRPSLGSEIIKEIR